MPSSALSSGASSKAPDRGIAGGAAPADAETGVILSCGERHNMTADQLKRKLRNFPTAKLTRIAALS